MPRPGIVRADTLDLQDQSGPSAQDHSKHPPQSTSSLESGRPAPHQQQSIQHAQEESKAEMRQNPTEDGRHLDPDEHRDSVDIYDEPEDMDSDSLQLERQNQQYGDDMGGVSEEGEFADGDDDMMDDDLMDKISSSPSIDDEDIDFEFVYALHNFVATVEGQANAAKGDTMVLLDDSNSYWWLVRVVKDGSIGYLPAEHIETPTERLARLNKHRNIDLSATMLGDNAEKSRNPLKKAMRRRNAKTVTFSAPTFIEASDVEFSTDDELDEVDYYNSDEEESSHGNEVESQDSDNRDIVVAPLRPKPKGIEEPESVQTAQEPDRQDLEGKRSSEESSQPQSEVTVSRSRNGTVRNTDSFFKDDTIETKKISLTPNLLRDELSTSTLFSEGRDGHGSYDSNDKYGSSNDKGKDDKKRKEKKAGMLSGLFKRKDKKNKAADDDVEEPDKSSGEFSPLSPQGSVELPSPESHSPKHAGQQRQPNRPQKQSQMDMKKGVQQEPMSPESTRNRQGTASAAKESIRRVFSPTTGEPPEATRTVRSSEDSRDTLASPGSPSSTSQTSPFVQSNLMDSLTSPVERAASETSNRVRQGSFDRTAMAQPPVISPPERLRPRLVMDHQDRDSESPVEVSHAEASAPDLTMDSSSRSASPVSPIMSPVADTDDSKAGGGIPVSTDTATSTETPTWSDASLRSYLDDGNDIRDLFIIIHDNSNVPPAGPDHPISGSLFKEESKRLKEMANQLDEMLVDWIGRKLRNSVRK